MTARQTREIKTTRKQHQQRDTRFPPPPTQVVFPGHLELPVQREIGPHYQRLLAALWLIVSSGQLISHSILILAARHSVFFLRGGCVGRTWTACWRARTGLCVWAGRGQTEPRRRAGRWQCIWRGGRRRAPASSEGPAPSAAAFSTRRDTGESPRADLRRRQGVGKRKHTRANKDTIGLGGK